MSDRRPSSGNAPPNCVVDEAEDCRSSSQQHDKTRQTAITTSAEQETARRKDNDEVFRQGRWKLGYKGQADGGLSGLATDLPKQRRLCYCLSGATSVKCWEQHLSFASYENTSADGRICAPLQAVRQRPQAPPKSAAAAMIVSPWKLKAKDLLVSSLHPVPLQACSPSREGARCIIGQGPVSVLSSAMAQASTPSMLLPVLISGPQSTPKTPTIRVANTTPNNPVACQVPPFSSKAPVLQLLLVWQMARWRFFPGRKA
ncbi:uncharacterized protein TRIVIDRAFT_198436 [Trichoderma virens Gv29-8]|uniref:Uncharacterized protein n=1 Tax=Hypocrea virens (strain Gv29-8 / FGSC 10586) TaxID=413071 RepID=G9MJ09_HYPVG|nr:uncharacterized protein TRIVIDRAFT_198436 [Trichoderma virens Gv29-8]EHK25474.1 hypothetical protein TRIVIDRAFT_198436 [Trichoderma virens Gv29-8]